MLRYRQTKNKFIKRKKGTGELRSVPFSMLRRSRILISVYFTKQNLYIIKNMT